jgi:putative ATPase
MTTSLTVGATRITAAQADITAVNVDAVVNAANEHLRHGGGLAAAIVRAGGESIQEESDRWVSEHGSLQPGTAAVTGAGAMPARFVIHVAGPRYREDRDNEGLLCRAVRAALDAAAGAGCRTVAVPAISAGVFGYPLGQATRVIACSAAAWAREHDDLERIDLVGYDDAAARGFADGLDAAAGC